MSESKVLDEMEETYKNLLVSIGEDPEREGKLEQLRSHK